MAGGGGDRRGPGSRDTTRPFGEALYSLTVAYACLERAMLRMASFLWEASWHKAPPIGTTHQELLRTRNPQGLG